MLLTIMRVHAYSLFAMVQVYGRCNDLPLSTHLTSDFERINAKTCDCTAAILPTTSRLRKSLAPICRRFSRERSRRTFSSRLTISATNGRTRRTASTSYTAGVCTDASVITQLSTVRSTSELTSLPFSYACSVERLGCGHVCKPTAEEIVQRVGFKADAVPFVQVTFSLEAGTSSLKRALFVSATTAHSATTPSSPSGAVSRSPPVMPLANRYVRSTRQRVV